MRHGGGSASGTVDLAFDADGDGTLEASETATVHVDASASDVQAALRALGGFLDDVDVSSDSGLQRARNGGEPWRDRAAYALVCLLGARRDTPERLKMRKHITGRGTAQMSVLHRVIVQPFKRRQG